MHRTLASPYRDLFLTTIFDFKSVMLLELVGFIIISFFYFEDKVKYPSDSCRSCLGVSKAKNRLYVGDSKVRGRSYLGESKVLLLRLEVERCLVDLAVK